MTRALFSGDWLVRGPSGVTPLAWTHAFEGVPSGGWSGGVNFKVTRAVAEQLAEIMNEYGRECDLAGGPSFLKVTRDALVTFEVCDLEFYVQEFDADGLVEVPSWTWYELDPDDVPRVENLIT